MNVTTFYSFKGGVGRTLALANVAYDLAKAGNRVLVVDFDLEAPGLHTIFSGPESKTTPGIVEFVRDYVKGTEPPDVRDHVYNWGHTDLENGSVWVMPAGRANDSYARRLGAIDWVDLYERQQGFLLFQDLRAQWRKRLKVDYVLIDSRTGHSDVTGICTRQLPDTLVILFYPNDQNLNGLQKVVADVRSEPEVTGRDRIEVLFVASNLPRLDDEESILRRRMKLFSDQLETGEIGRVHRYDSLDLLERPLFVQHRPRSRLAREFRGVTGNVRMKNTGDREGALQWLNHLRSHGEPFATEPLEKRLSRVEEAHSSDGEVLYGIGHTRLLLGQLQEAAALHQQAIETGFARPHVFLSRAEILQRLGDFSGAAETASAVFHDSSTTVATLRGAISLLRLTEPDRLTTLAGSQAVNDLLHEERVGLANQLDRELMERQIAYELLMPLIQRSTGKEEWFGTAQFTFGLAALALGKPAEADEAFRGAVARNKEDVASVFNLAMSRWALTGAPDRALFESAFAASPTEQMGDSANFLQCMALAEHICGRDSAAEDSLRKSRRAIKRRSSFEFSCWRYLRVSRDAFLADLEAMEAWFAGKAPPPAFIRKDHLSLAGSDQAR